MSTNYVFERIEKKYLISEKKFNIILERIGSNMAIDKYGIHTICNIYYDTDTYELIRNSIEKPNYKEKLRLRSYGIPRNNDNVFLEIKKKHDSTVFKRRISLTLKEAENYMKQGIRPHINSQILNEIDYFINFYNPKEKIFIAYDRIAMYGKEDKNLRITFDMNIRSRLNDLSLGKGDYGNPLYNDNIYLMEIKTSTSFPLWLTKILSELEIYSISFSKYGSIYKQLLNEDWRNNKCLQAS